MRNTGVDALVSLDSGIAFAHNTRLLKQSPYYDPAKLRVPLLHATNPGEEIEASGASEDRSLFEAAVFATTYWLRLKGLRHDARRDCRKVRRNSSSPAGYQGAL
jgi:hypothetical protein